MTLPSYVLCAMLIPNLLLCAYGFRAKIKVVDDLAEDIGAEYGNNTRGPTSNIVSSSSPSISSDLAAESKRHQQELVDERKRDMYDLEQDSDKHDTEFVNLTHYFLPNSKIASVPTGSGAVSSFCCCRLDMLYARVTCEIVPTDAPKTIWWKSGCGGALGDDYHSWNTIPTLPEFANVENAGSCVIPYLAIDAHNRLFPLTRVVKEASVAYQSQLLKPKVLLIDVDEIAKSILSPCLDFEEMKPGSEADLIAQIPSYDALICRSSTRVTGKVLAAAQKLKIVSLAMVGTKIVDTEDANARGIRVCNSPSGNAISTAENAVALIFSLLRNIPMANATMKKGTWTRDEFLGRQLHGLKIGFVCFGQIARLVAKTMNTVGMKIFAWGTRDSPEKVRQEGAGAEKIADLQDLLRQVDVLSLHCPLKEETRGLIGKEELNLMPKGSFLINTGRGGVVDEHALDSALSSGHLAGAALDVFENEQEYTETGKFTSPLTKHSNVVLIPHISAMTISAQKAAATDAASQVRDFLCSSKEPEFALNEPDTANPGMLKMKTR